MLACRKTKNQNTQTSLKECRFLPKSTQKHNVAIYIDLEMENISCLLLWDGGKNIKEEYQV